MIAIGPERFDEFLAGGAAMDDAFPPGAPLRENLPVLLALVGIWHNQICGYATPRGAALRSAAVAAAGLSAAAGDGDRTASGWRWTARSLTRDSGPVVWGEPGTNGQHAFYQLIHQGTRVVPCEFMLAREGHEPDLAHQHRLLVANCLAQSEALMRGRSPGRGARR